MAEKNGRRHSLRAPCEQSLKAPILVGCDVSSPSAQQTRQIDPQGMSQEDPSLAMRLVDAGCAKSGGRCPEHVLKRARHASAEVKLARRAA